MQVRGYEAQVRQIEAAVQHRAHAGSRAQLLGQREELVGQSSSSQRDCLLQSTQKLDKSSDRIKQSRQTVADMEVRLYVPTTESTLFQGSSSSHMQVCSWNGWCKVSLIWTYSVRAPGAVQADGCRHGR